MNAYGQPDTPKVSAPLEMILYENVGYMVNDAKRDAAYDALRARVGTASTDILSASGELLLEIAKLGGMLPQMRVEKLRKIARIVQDEFDGDLDSVLKLPLPKAKKALQKFPGIGVPGAEKILLFSKTFPLFPLESNGLRALIRIGYGKEDSDYSRMYRSVQEAVSGELETDYDWLISAHLLLRQHGKEICLRNLPTCNSCPLTQHCDYYQKSSQS